MLLGLGHLVQHQIGLADIFMRAQMPWIDLQRTLVVFKRRLKLTGISIRIPQRIMDIRVIRIPLIRGVVPFDGRGPILCVRRAPAQGPGGQHDHRRANAEHADQINAIRLKDAHSELERWLAGDHRPNNDVRPSELEKAH